MDVFQSIDPKNVKALWAILEHSRDGIALFDICLNRFTYVTPSYTELIGYTLHELLKLSEADFMDRIHPEDQVEFSEKYTQVLSGFVDQNESVYRWKKKDGSECWIQDIRIMIKEEDKAMYRVVICRDITKEHEQDAEVDAFLNINLDMLCVSDKEGRFVKVNKRFEEILGYSTEELTGVEYLNLIVEEDRVSTYNVLKKLNHNQSVLNFTNRYICKNGDIKYIEWHTQPTSGKFLYASARDVTEKHLYEKRLNELVLKDALTGLYNRRFLEETIIHEISQVDRYDELISMIEYDIDHFKEINDSYGHSVGDQVLKDLSNIVSTMIRGSDYLFRVGGEEFILILPHTPLEEARLLAERIRKKIEENIHPKVGQYTCSFGVTQRILRESYEDWYNRTDSVLYAAKMKGRNCVVID